METLASINFSDLFIGADGIARLKHINSNLTVTESPDVQAIAALCAQQEALGQSEYLVSHDGVNYRGSVIRAIGGNSRVLRKVTSIKGLMETGLQTQVITWLLQRYMSGLVLIAGNTGSGKTTTASTLISERLQRYGGVCVTVEDPPEHKLDGQHGQGICYQIQANVEGGYATALSKVMRMAPDMILIGEVRDPETAAEVIRASVNGHLVIATIHAGSPVEAVSRLVSLCPRHLLDMSMSILADGIAGVIHQSLTNGRLNATPLMFNGANSAGMRSKVRRGEFVHLNQDLEVQATKMHLKVA